MRTCKKLVALVMALAMLATMFAFSASAADGDVLKVVANGDPVAGQDYVVSVKVVDADDSVGGVSGVITVEGAALGTVAVADDLKTDNNTEDADTIVKVDGNSFKFAAVGDDGEWFKLTLTGLVEEANVKVTASDVKASNATGSATTDIAVENLSVVVPVSDTGINVLGASIRGEKDVTKQGMRYSVGFDEDFDFSQVTEVGIIYAPKQLVDLSNFKIGADEDIKTLSVASTDSIFNYIKADKGFNAYVLTGIEGNTDGSYKMLGVRIAVRAYYKIGEKIYYSQNNQGSISSGIDSRAHLNVTIALAETEETKTFDVTAILADKTKLTTGTDKYTNRQTLVDFVVENVD
ncbi:MAG: hypothetical protein J6B93_02130 [Clostridia bacterium]|nr:hypothetical protein [Clostridia bacterium]